MISVIIPLYNKEKYIRRTVESVLGQDYEDYEIVIVNDGSTDNSLSVLDSIFSEKIKIFSKNNGGPSSARNYGVQKAKGDWIIIMDADDCMESGALTHFAELARKNPHINFFCCNHYKEKCGNKLLYSEFYRDGIVFDNFYSWSLGTLLPQGGSWMMKKSLLIDNPYNESLWRFEDAEFLFRIMRVERVFRSSFVAMSYNQNSLCASAGRKDISEDFIGHLDVKGKSLWEQYALYQLYAHGWSVYPKDMNRLYKMSDFLSFRVRLINLLLKLMKKIGIRHIPLS